MFCDTLLAHIGRVGAGGCRSFRVLRMRILSSAGSTSIGRQPGNETHIMLREFAISAYDTFSPGDPRPRRLSVFGVDTVYGISERSRGQRPERNAATNLPTSRPPPGICHTKCESSRT